MKRGKMFTNAMGILALSTLLGGCATDVNEDEVEVNNVEVKYSEVTSGDTEKYTAKLDIEGMSCEMMCGNKIASTLNGLEGVLHTDIDFKGLGEVSSALVEYDVLQISEKELIAAVSGIAEGIYKVKAVEVVHQTPGAVSAEATEKKPLGFKPAINYRLPNIFSVFARLM